jgi:hypothetical protein
MIKAHDVAARFLTPQHPVGVESDARLVAARRAHAAREPEGSLAAADQRPAALD